MNLAGPIVTSGLGPQGLGGLGLLSLSKEAGERRMEGVEERSTEEEEGVMEMMREDSRGSTIGRMEED